MLKKSIFISFIATILLIISGCNLFFQNDSKARIIIGLPSSRSLANDIGFYEVVVTASDINDITVSGEITENSSSSVSIEVAVGTERTVTVKLYEDISKSLLLFQGEETVDISSGGEVVVEINADQYARLISFDDNGAISGVLPDSAYYNDGDTFTIPDNTGGLSLTGYSFGGWSSGGIDYSPGDLFTVSGSSIFSALWNIIGNSVFYNLYGGIGTVPIDGNDYDIGDTVTVLSGSTPTRGGFTFAGWGTNPWDSAESTFLMSIYTKNIYALWTADSSSGDITYDITGGSGSTPTGLTAQTYNSWISVDDGSGLIPNSGYTFVGWKTQDDITINSSSILMLPGTQTFSAQWSNAYVFTNAGATGNVGPTQTEIDLTYITDNPLTGLVTVDSGYPGYQQWTVPSTGTYTIEAYGASGGYSENSGDIKGAYIKGSFELTAGQVLIIAVGQEGESMLGDYDAGGGGGTFVVNSMGTPTDLSDDVPLLIAGGGSGTSSDGAANSGSESQYPTGSFVAPNGLGQGGGYPSDHADYAEASGAAIGPGGGGFYSDGQSIYTSANGKGYTSGLEGGTSTHGTGGFGGGAAGQDEYGTAGGGYTGGTGRDDDSSNGSGGGGSYNSGADQTNVGGRNYGHGRVIITLL